MSSISKSRRKFITDSAKGAIAVSVGLSAIGSLLPSGADAKNNAAGLIFANFDQQPLPYKYDALENVIDAMTMEIHYSKHAAARSEERRVGKEC